jgi:hypothetical protein
MSKAVKPSPFGALSMLAALLVISACDSPLSSREEEQSREMQVGDHFFSEEIEADGSTVSFLSPGASAGTCSFEVNGYGLSATNSYGYYADCTIYKVAWAAVKAPRYYSSTYYGGYSQFETATFREIPVGAKQTYLYKVTVTFRAKYPSGYEKYFEVSKSANIYPRDAGKWLRGWFYLRSWNIPIPAY